MFTQSRSRRFRPEVVTLEDRFAPASFTITAPKPMPATAEVAYDTTNTVVFSGKTTQEEVVAHNLTFTAGEGFSPGYTLSVFGNAESYYSHGVIHDNFVTFDLPEGIPSGIFYVSADKVEKEAAPFCMAYYSVDLRDTYRNVPIWRYDDGVDIQHNLEMTTYTVVAPVPIIMDVALSSDTPAAGTIVGGQSAADLAHFTFTGEGTITALAFERFGESWDTSLGKVYLYDGNQRITQGQVLDPNDIFFVKGLSLIVTGTKTISIRADVPQILSMSKNIAIDLTGYTVGRTPFTTDAMGNTMTIVTQTLAAIMVGNSTLPEATSVKTGTASYTLYAAPVQVTTHPVWMKMVSFLVSGTAPVDTLRNVRLFVDGIDLGKSVTMITIQGSNYAMFDLADTPASLTVGMHQLAVKEDINEGVGQTVQLSLTQTVDLVVYDPLTLRNVTAGRMGRSTFSSSLGPVVSIKN